MNIRHGHADPTLYKRVIEPRWTSIPHYYGDMVRILFLAATVMLLVGAPFYADQLQLQLPYIVIGAVIIVALAAFTNPVKKWIIRADAVVAGVGAVIFEMWALNGYEAGTALDFVLRQVPAIIFIFAFYFSLKTLRAMLLDQVGKPDEVAISSSSRERPVADLTGEDELDLDGLGHKAALEDDMGA